jgi:RNA polymerase sigma-70 factor, ECF subfamily
MNVGFTVSDHGPDDMSEMLGDEVLVLAAQAGDAAAFGELWIRHSKMTFRVLMKVTKNREDAEDGMQETFLKAFAHLSTFEARAKFSTWLTRIAVNCGLMILRRQRSRPTISIDSQYDGENWKQWDVEDRSLDIESSFMRTECYASIASAVNRLGPTLSVVLRHQLSKDCSIAETAKSNGLTIGATKSRLIRARKALRGPLAWYKRT